MQRTIHVKQSTIAQLKSQLFENERAMRVLEISTHMDAIRMRLTRPEVKVPVSAFVPYEPKPDPRTRRMPNLPSYREWKIWVSMRTGVLPVQSDTENVKILCIACGLPTEISGSVPVVIGAMVKWTEELEKTWNVYNPLLDNVVEVEEIKKVSIVTHKALGCQECANIYRKTVSETVRINETRRGKVHEKGRKVGQPLGDLTAFLMVDVKQIDPNSTVRAYWKATEVKP